MMESEMEKLSCKSVTLTCPMHHEMLASSLWDFYKAQRGVDLYLPEAAGREPRAVHQIVADAFLSSEKLVRKLDGAGQSDTTGQAAKIETSGKTESNLQADKSTCQTEAPILADGFLHSDIFNEAGTSFPVEEPVGVDRPSHADMSGQNESTDGIENGKQENAVGQAEISAQGDTSGQANPTKLADDLLANVLEFLYTGKVTVGEKQLASLLEVAEQLDFEALVNAVRSANESSIQRRSRGRPPAKRRGRKPSHPRPIRKVTRGAEGSDQMGRGDSSGSDDDELTPKMARKPAGAAASGFRKGFANRKQWGLPPDELNLPAADATSSGETGASEAVLQVTKEKVIKCGHCSFTSRDKEDATLHIWTEHINAVQQGQGDASKDGLTKRIRSYSECADMVSAMDVLNVTITSGRKGSDSEYDDVSSDSSEATGAEGSASADKPTLKCPDCDFQTVSGRDFRMHLTAHDPSVAYFKCRKCNRPFPTAESFERHAVLEHVSSPSTLRCPRCRYRPRRFKLYLEHLRVIHQIDDRGEPISDPCKCPNCPFACSDAGALAQHVRSHGVKPASKPSVRLCRCSKCDFTCTNVADLESHNCEQVFKCEHCDFTNAIKSTVRQHNKKVHLRIRRFVCETCGHAAFSPSHLAQHKIKHTGERPYICEVCGRGFTDPSTLRRHIKGHGDNVPRPFACEQCPFSSRRKHNLAMHVRTVHGSAEDKPRRRPSQKVAPPLLLPPPPPSTSLEVVSDGDPSAASLLKCRLCPYKTDQQPHMTQHVRQEHGPHVNAYVCDLCEYTGKSADMLQRHRRLHTSEKPFLCIGCNVAFRDYGTYRRHQLGHCKPDESFPCSPDQGFSQLRYLSAHLRRDHQRMRGVGDSPPSDAASPDRPLMYGGMPGFHTNEGHYHSELGVQYHAMPESGTSHSGGWSNP